MKMIKVVRISEVGTLFCWDFFQREELISLQWPCLTMLRMCVKQQVHGPQSISDWHCVHANTRPCSLLARPHCLLSSSSEENHRFQQAL